MSLFRTSFPTGHYVKRVFRSAAKLNNEPIHMPPERLAKTESYLTSHLRIVVSRRKSIAFRRSPFYLTAHLARPLARELISIGHLNFEGLEQFMESIIYNNGLPDLYL